MYSHYVGIVYFLTFFSVNEAYWVDVIFNSSVYKTDICPCFIVIQEYE